MKYPTKNEIDNASGVLICDEEGWVPSGLRSLKFNGEDYENLWMFSESFGPVAVIRTRFLHDAYEIALQYMAKEDVTEWDEEQRQAWETKGELPEGVLWCDDLGCYVREDLNGSRLEPLEDFAKRHNLDVFALQNVAEVADSIDLYYEGDDPFVESCFAMVCDEEPSTD